MPDEYVRSSPPSIIQRVNPQKPEREVIRMAVAHILDDGLVAFPTETVYGLGAHGLSSQAVTRIFKAKGRPAWNPVILHVADIHQMHPLIADKVNAPLRRLLQAGWPGPLTVVVERSPRVPDIVTAGGDEVAIRCPSHPVARALIEESGVPIAAPSANRSQHISPTSAEHVWNSLGEAAELILDGGECAVGIESTVCRMHGDSVQILREGGYSHEWFERQGFTVRNLRGEMGREREGSSSRDTASPGQDERHYAPGIPLLVLDGGDDFVLSQLSARSGEKDVAFVVFDEYAPELQEMNIPPDKIFHVGTAQNLKKYAALLYQKLHEADDSGVISIVAVAPQAQGVGRALRDRLYRASDQWISEG